jgi:hypothetical protein
MSRSDKPDRSLDEAALNRLGDGDVPDDPTLAALMRSLSDNDPDVVAGMERLRLLREQEAEIRELPARNES